MFAGRPRKRPRPPLPVEVAPAPPPAKRQCAPLQLARLPPSAYDPSGLMSGASKLLLQARRLLGPRAMLLRRSGATSAPCTRACPWLGHGDHMLCTAHGTYHVCGHERCEHACERRVNEHTGEARECRLTGQRLGFSTRATWEDQDNGRQRARDPTVAAVWGATKYASGERRAAAVRRMNVMRRARAADPTQPVSAAKAAKVQANFHRLLRTFLVDMCGNAVAALTSLQWQTTEQVLLAVWDFLRKSEHKAGLRLTIRAQSLTVWFVHTQHGGVMPKCRDGQPVMVSLTWMRELQFNMAAVRRREGGDQVYTNLRTMSTHSLEAINAAAPDLVRDHVERLTRIVQRHKQAT